MPLTKADEQAREMFNYVRNQSDNLDFQVQVARDYVAFRTLETLVKLLDDVHKMATPMQFADGAERFPPGDNFYHVKSPLIRMEEKRNRTMGSHVTDVRFAVELEDDGRLTLVARTNGSATPILTDAKSENPFRAEALVARFAAAIQKMDVERE